MKSLTAVGIVLKAALLVSTLFLLGAHATVATEYSQHFGALRKLSVAVAEGLCRLDSTSSVLIQAP